VSVVGLCVVFIPGWVGAGKVAEPIGSGVPVRGGRQLELRRRGITQKGTNYIGLDVSAHCAPLLGSFETATVFTKTVLCLLCIHFIL